VVIWINMLHAGKCRSIVLGFFTYSMIFVISSLFESSRLSQLSKLNISDGNILLSAMSSRYYTYFVLLILFVNFYMLNRGYPPQGAKLLYMYAYGLFVALFPFTLYQRTLTNLDKISNTLQNGLVSIHPCLIYIVYISIFYIMIVLRYTAQSRDSRLRKLFERLFLLALLILFGIFLGAF